VVFATNSKGRVIARKLIAISTDGKLLGFHDYTGLEDADANNTLLHMLHGYCGDFAHACHLELANDGEVQTLFAEDWYNDGYVEW
jgi:hypothetical protein